MLSIVLYVLKTIFVFDFTTKKMQNKVYHSHFYHHKHFVVFFSLSGGCQREDAAVEDKASLHLAGDL